MKGLKFWLLLAMGLIMGLGIAWVDSRPSWDDTGITVAAILLTTLLLGLALPKQAWLWALAVGIWIPARGIAVEGNFGTTLALVMAFVGAYLGASARKAMVASGKPG